MTFEAEVSLQGDPHFCQIKVKIKDGFILTVWDRTTIIADPEWEQDVARVNFRYSSDDELGTAVRHVISSTIEAMRPLDSKKEEQKEWTQIQAPESYDEEP